MTRNNKTLLRCFLWSWLITVPITLFGAYVMYKSWDRYQDFMIRYDATPYQLNLSELTIYQLKRTQRELIAAFYRYRYPTQLKTIHLYASKADLFKLDQNLPHSGYQYIKARLIDDHEIVKAKIRYRGDYLPHWGYEKKSFKVKMTKKHLFQGMRIFNLIAPKFPEQLNSYLAYQLAETLGLITPRNQLVRVFLNNQDQGVYTLVEQIKETTLRNHKLMPGDIYRGEIVGKDAFTESGYNHLFEAADIWDKVAINNHYPEQSKAPLARLLSALNQQNTVSGQSQLEQSLDLESWARFSAFETLTQTWHFDMSHNWRLYYDPWRQKMLPIVWDPAGWRWLLSTGAVQRIQFTPLHQALFKNGNFIRLRQQFLTEFYSNGQAENFLKKVADSHQIMSKEILSDAYLNPPDIKQVQTALDELKEAISRVFKAIKTSIIETDTPVLYQFEKQKLHVFLRDPKPLKRLKIDFNNTLSEQPAVEIKYLELDQIKYRDLSANSQSSGNQLEIKLDLVPGFYSQTQSLAFYQTAIHTQILDRFEISISTLQPQHKAIMVWADYGNGWQAAKKIDTSELISLDEQTLIASPSRLPFQQHLMPWVVSGQNQLNQESLPPVTLYGVIDSDGLWQQQLQLPTGTHSLQIKPPLQPGLLISEITMCTRDHCRPVTESQLSSNGLQWRKGYWTKTANNEAVFKIDLSPLESDIRDHTMVVLSFKVFHDLSWQQVMQQQLMPVSSRVYSTLPKLDKTDPIIWQGDILINKPITIDRPLIIRPGSRIRFTPNAGIIIKNRLWAIGLPGQTIEFIPENPQQAAWGSVVLMGQQANESILKYCHFAHGSGLKDKHYEYTGMLSIHNVKKVYIEHCEFNSNHHTDDMLHAVYAELHIKHCTFINAFADALDLDISKAVIENSRFENNGNDAIDLMTTEATITQSLLASNSDKAVSVGEASALVAVNNKIRNNHIGIEAKDHAIALIINQDFSSNELALNAYKKNWRYGDGGDIIVSNSSFINNQQFAANDRHSEIYIADSYLSPMPITDEIRAIQVEALNPKQAQLKKLPDSMISLPGYQRIHRTLNSAWLNQVDFQIRGTTSDVR